jgi:hypothetical protein
MSSITSFEARQSRADFRTGLGIVGIWSAVAGALGLIGYGLFVDSAMNIAPETVKTQIEGLGYTQVEVGEREVIVLLGDLQGCTMEDVAKFPVTGTDPNGVSRHFHACANADGRLNFMF